MATSHGVPVGPNPGFATTRWSAVVAAGGGDEAAAARALAWLCEAYWQPLHDHARRRGHDAHAAQDLVQGFFARLCEKRDLAADPSRGRFRSYLLGALDHFLSNERDREQALKRGGGQRPARLGRDSGVEPRDERTPERAFARAWALTVLERALARVAQEYADDSRGQFAALEPFITDNATGETYAATGARIGMSEGAVKVAVHRLRRRYAELLREEVADTIADPVPRTIEEELRELLEALRS
jgi:DNA-directed RNA polymerase specialized sigma24 family protein